MSNLPSGLYCHSKRRPFGLFCSKSRFLDPWSLPNCDPLHKVSIIPRGGALGITMSLPIDERHTYSREYHDDLIAMTLGGRAAEEIVFGDVTNGASDDIRRATEVARKMVNEFGMSKTIGCVHYGSSDSRSPCSKSPSTNREKKKTRPPITSVRLMKTSAMMMSMPASGPTGAVR